MFWCGDFCLRQTKALACQFYSQITWSFEIQNAAERLLATQTMFDMVQYLDDY